MSYKILMPVVILLLMTGCKSSEKNYREAYEIVQAKRAAEKQDMDEIDGLLAGQGTRFTTGKPAIIKVGDDTLYTRVEYVRMTPPPASKKKEKDAQPQPPHAPMERYCIVAGQFRQQFNARTLADRLKFLGYDAFIVNNNTPTYYVIAGTYSMAIRALEALHEIRDDKRFTPISPCPWVLQPAHLAR